MPLITLAGGRHSLAQQGGQADPVGQLTNRHCTGVIGHTATIASHHQLLGGPASLHPQGAFLALRELGLDNRSIPCQEGVIADAPRLPTPSLLNSAG